MVVSRFTQVTGRDLFPGSSKAALVKFNRTVPELGRSFLKNLKGLGPNIARVIFPVGLSQPQNRQLARRIATEQNFLYQYIQDGVLDLRKAPIAKPALIDRTADFPEKQLYDRLRTIFEPRNLDLAASDHEIGNLTLFRSLWQARVMIYKAQYLLSPGLPDQTEAVYQEAKGLLIYARRFVTQLLNEFPFSYQMYRHSMEMLPSLFDRGNPGAIDAVLISVTDRLGSDCDRQEAARLRRERDRQSLPAAGSLADSINYLARVNYGIRIGPDGVWEIPQATLKSAGAVLRRERVVPRVDESAVVRRTQDQIDSICAEREKLAGVIQDLKPFTLAQPELAAALDKAALGRSLEACGRGQVAPKVTAHLLIGLAADLFEVAGATVNVPEMSPARERLLKFSCSMLSMASRHLAERDQVLHNQVVRLEVKKRILEALVDKRAKRYEALKAAAASLSQKLMDEDFMARPGNIDILRKEAIAAYRLVQSEKDLEAGVALGKKHLRDMTMQARRLIDASSVKRELLDELSRGWRPEGDNGELLAPVAAINEGILALRTEMAHACYCLRYHLEHRFSPEMLDGKANDLLQIEIAELLSQQDTIMNFDLGFILRRDLVGLAAANDNRRPREN